MSIVCRVQIFFVVLLLSFNISAQESQKKYSISFSHVSLSQALERLSKETSTTIAFSEDLLPKQMLISSSYANRDVKSIVKDLLKSTEFQVVYEGGVYAIIKTAKKVHHIYGYIVSEETGEKLPLATIVVDDQSDITSSNDEGYFNVALEEGRHQLAIYYLGHKTRVESIEVNQSDRFDLTLSSNSLLPEIIVDESQSTYVSASHNKYNASNLMDLARKTPGLGGSNDLLQTAKSLAGVQSGAAGIGGLFIRGGNNSQNLYLLDGVSVYNPFHSLGMASIFTPQTTKSLQIIKSGFRPQYGDRSSAILDIRLKDGNNKEFKPAVGINPQDGFVKLEGPLPIKDASFFIYGRNTTSAYKFNDLIRQSLFGDFDSESKTKYHDIIAKVAIPINVRHRLLGTYFKSADKVGGLIEFFEDEAGYEIYDELNLSWGNEIVNLQWQGILSSDFFMNASLSSNKYFSTFELYQLEEDEDEVLVDFYYEEISSQNQDIEGKINVDFNPLRALRITSGLGFLYQKFQPEFQDFDEFSEELEDISEVTIDSLQSFTNDFVLTSQKLYHHIEATVSLDKLKISGGLRSTYFTYDDFASLDFQPRLSLDYATNRNFSYWASFSKTVQYIHLLSNSEIHLPRDLWYPANDDAPPEDTYHYNFGSKYEVSTNTSIQGELFYKYSANKNLSEQNSLGVGTFNPQAFAMIGEAKSYGVELSYTTKLKRWDTKWAYTMSKSDLQFDNLNAGARFAFQFDRTHELKSIHTLDIRGNWVIGLNTYLASGHPYLITSNLDLNDGLNAIDVNPIGRKNSLRDGWQYRIDISLLYSFKASVFNHDLKFNVYNALDNTLPLFYTESSSGSSFDPGFSVPFIPSLSYVLRFN